MLYKTIGGLNEYKKIFDYGYGCESIELFTGNYWIILFKLFFGLHNKYLSSVSNSFKELEVLHILDNTLFAYPILKFFLKETNVKLIYTIHDPSPHIESKLIRKLMRQLILTSHFFVNKLSQKEPSRLFIHIHSKKILPNYLRRNNSILIEPHPLSIVNNNVVDVFDISKNHIISFVGRIEYYKGVDVLLKSIIQLDRIIHKNKNVKVVIAGRGNYKLSIPQTTNIEIIHLDRFVSNDELDSLIKYSKIVVLPYREATSSGVLTRVISHNTPVIVSNKGCLPDYVEHGVNGFVFKAESQLPNLIYSSIGYQFKPAKNKFDAREITAKLLNKIKKYESS